MRQFPVPTIVTWEPTEGQARSAVGIMGKWTIASFQNEVTRHGLPELCSVLSSGHVMCLHVCLGSDPSDG
jgi:hypothetical protein